MQYNAVTRRAAIRLLPLILVLALSGPGLAGCGDAGGTSAATTGGKSSASGSLKHVDGTVKLADQSLLVTPSAGGEPLSMAAGPELAAAELQALTASAEPVRVYFRDGDDPVAVRVQRTAATDSATSATGAVTEISDTTLTLQPDGGGDPLRLTIRPEDAAGFDVVHLKQHQSQKASIKVFYEEANGAAYALSYEDA